MYEQSITRSAKALFVIAIDQSCSMAGEIMVLGQVVSKAAMVAQVANDLIAELVERSRRDEGVRDYYDVAIVGYSGRGVESLLPSGVSTLSITSLDECCHEVKDIIKEYTVENGERRFFRCCSRQWIKPLATGSTPIYEALLTVHDLTREWCSKLENRESFPPLIFNITDGESSDCGYSDIEEVASKLKSNCTLDGNALLFNIHIASEASAQPLLFPSLEEFAASGNPSPCAQALYNSASDIPQMLSAAVCEIKGGVEPAQFKAMSYNCSISELITILNIGSISMKRA